MVAHSLNAFIEIVNDYNWDMQAVLQWLQAYEKLSFCSLYRSGSDLANMFL